MHDPLAKSLYEKWAKSITENAQEVVKLYDENAVLLPTVRGNYINNKKDIEQYCEVFCALKPQATLTEGEYRSFYEGNIIIFTGHYSFSFAAQADAMARFSFIFKTTSSNPILGKNCHIIHHHSSPAPALMLEI